MKKTAIYRICQTITRQAIGLNCIKQLKIDLHVNDNAGADDEVCLDIAISPIPEEKNDATQDTVDGRAGPCALGEWRLCHANSR